MLNLTVLAGEYAVCKLPEDSAAPRANGTFFAAVHSPGELTIVCEEGIATENARVERGWRVLRLEGPFEFSETGILASVLNPLAEAMVGIFAVSTFNTDYVLVKSANLARAIEALRSAGHSVTAL